MHFILTRKLKFLLQRGHQITSKSICPLSLFLSPDCRPSAISSPLQTNHNHRGGGRDHSTQGEGVARWPPHIHTRRAAQRRYYAQRRAYARIHAEASIRAEPRREEDMRRRIFRPARHSLKSYTQFIGPLHMIPCKTNSFHHLFWTLSGRCKLYTL